MMAMLLEDYLGRERPYKADDLLNSNNETRYIFCDVCELTDFCALLFSIMF